MASARPGARRSSWSSTTSSRRPSTRSRGSGRFILFGVAGSVALAIGLVILAVAFLRLLQGETGTTFTGNLSWVPYLICTVAVVLVAAIAVRAVSRGQGRAADDTREGDPMSPDDQTDHP